MINNTRNIDHYMDTYPDCLVHPLCMWDTADKILFNRKPLPGKLTAESNVQVSGMLVSDQDAILHSWRVESPLTTGVLVIYFGDKPVTCRRISEFGGNSLPLDLIYPVNSVRERPFAIRVVDRPCTTPITVTVEGYAIRVHA